jgi:dienelactone hydrolase
LTGSIDDKREGRQVTELTAERLHYNYAGTELIGYLVRAAGTPRPGVLLIHDARGVSEPMKAIARRIAELGYSVLLVDLWGGGKTPGGDEEIGPLIGGLVSDPESWLGRVRAGHEALLASADVAEAPVTAVGYCFGGSSALEYLRRGGGVDGVVTLHGGLETIGTDWSEAHTPAKVLVLTGAEDPMASRDLVETLEDGLTSAGIDWEVARYGATKHAFTSPDVDKAGRPDVLAYNARADHRSWNALTLFLEEMHDGVVTGV